MALFHFSAKAVSRGKGQSAIAKAAYNARDKIRDEQTGQIKDYARAPGAIFSAIFAPKDAPAWTQDRAALWNAVERAEGRKDAQLAREITLGLPHELTDDQRRQLLTDFVREQFQRKGMIADVNIHAPGCEGDGRNHHVHILLTMRRIGPNGFGPKVREWNSREQLENWREAWERIQNRYLARYGYEARVDRRTLEAQGIDREPTTHLGPRARAIERHKGIETERGNIYRDILLGEQETAKLKRELAEIEKQIAVAERHARTTQPKGQGGKQGPPTITRRFQKAARAVAQREKDARPTPAFKLAEVVFSRSAENWHKRQRERGGRER
jgi:ATP-dependent exoDNAse (exonuclease V) alpha subunit